MLQRDRGRNTRRNAIDAIDAIDAIEANEAAWPNGANGANEADESGAERAMTLFIRHGSHLEALADELAERLADPPADAFEPVVVAVPTAGVRDWLGRRLATRLGITANILMPFPGRFVAAALGTPLEANDPWDVDRLTWAVLDVLESGTVDVPGWSQATRPSQSRRYSVARRLADLFDRYATNRPQVLQQWQRGVAGDGTERPALLGGSDENASQALVGTLDPAMTWQYHLWRAVCAAIGTPSPAERLPDLVARLRRGELEPALPSLVAMFGAGTISPSQLEVLDALGDVREVRLSIIHPSPVLWHRTGPLPPGQLVSRRRFEETGVAPDDTHPLLRSWGRLNIETAALMRGLEPPAGGRPALIVDARSRSDQPPSSLLQHLQGDILGDRAPSPYVAAAGDRSVQVHACHGATRQLEVLRDVLGHLFVSDPGLQPRDVLVLCPDLDRFEPFAKAVFSRGSLPVPLAISDLSLETENPVAAALTAVLSAVADRTTTVDVLAIAALDPVRHRLGITLDDLVRFGSWTDRLCTSWGIDMAHRSEWLALDIDAGTWEASLRALLVGAAMPAPEPRVGFGGVVPYDDIGADDLRSAGRLAELIGRLRRCRELVSGTRPIGEWCAVLTEVLGLLCAPDPTDAWQTAAVLDAIESLRDEAVVNGKSSAVTLDLADIRAIVGRLVAGQRGRLQLRSGRVTMTGMVPVRNVPAKVVCLLGFDETALRPSATDGDDVLSLRPCVGERDQRAEQRQLVLDALMAAERNFVVVCDGNDITTNRRIRFPVQLAELLDVIEATSGRGADGLESTVLVRHPLRAFDEDNFRHGGITATSGAFGFDDTMCRAAQARRDATVDGAAPATPLRWSTKRPIPPTVDLAELTQACTRPARTLLQRGLDVRVPGEVERRDTNIPLCVSHLESANLGRRLVAQYRAAARDGDDAPTALRAARDRWAQSEALHAGNPPRRLIDESLLAVSNEVDRLIELAAASDLGLTSSEIISASRTIDIDMELSYNGRAVGVAANHAATRPAGTLRLVDTVADIAGSTLCRLNYRRPKQRVVVGAALDLAAVVVSSGSGDWQALTVTRGSSGTKPEGQVLKVVAGDPVATARSLLETAAELHVAALRGAVPLFEETSQAAQTSGFLDEELLLGNGFGPCDMDDPHTNFVWGSVSTAEMLALTPSPLFLAKMLWNDIRWLVSIEKLTTVKRARR